ncbi:hypothetical protein EDC94DRAFT_645680 [Helicostylum pulchrum]|nr:hypothetical protein EDC94DRAFT_645680 [Helicostylum pulchrum]
MNPFYMQQLSNFLIYQLFGLCLTDFWEIYFNEDFRKDHKRSSWMERIVPLFKYLGAVDKVVFSWCENQIKPREPKRFWYLVEHYHTVSKDLVLSKCLSFSFALHVELKEQRLMEDLLVRQQNQIIPVDATGSLRFMLQSARQKSL